MSCWDLNIKVSCDEICFDLSFEGCNRYEAWMCSGKEIPIKLPIFHKHFASSYTVGHAKHLNRFLKWIRAVLRNKMLAGMLLWEHNQ